MYRDPSVGNLINIVIVKLVIIHNEQVSSPGNTPASFSVVRFSPSSLPDVSAGVPIAGGGFHFPSVSGEEAGGEEEDTEPALYGPTSPERPAFRKAERRNVTMC